MSLQEEGGDSSLRPYRKARTKQKGTEVVEITESLVGVRAELDPPLEESTLHIVSFNKGTHGIICGPAPAGMEKFDFIVTFEYGPHWASVPVRHTQIRRL
jgi:hypothetical protein